MPFEDIAQILLFEQKRAKDSVATKTEMKFSGNYMNDLDKQLQNVLDIIIKKQKEAVDFNGGNDKIYTKIKFEDLKCEIEIRKVYAIGELKQLKMEYLNMNKVNPMPNITEACKAFVYYVKQSIIT